MAVKCKCPPAGAPAWVLTFGDMMSLLLTFFILLLSLSEIKKDDEFRAVVKEVKKAFGMHGGGGRVPSKSDPELTFIERIKSLQLVSRKEPKKSVTVEQSIDGKNRRVTTLRQAVIQTAGGKNTFEPGSTRLSREYQAALVGLAPLLRDYKTKIIVSGHANAGEPIGSDHHDLRDLSYARARAVHDLLIGAKCRIRPERIRIEANGDSEPVTGQVYNSVEQRHNRRVEIFLTDLLVDEFSKPELDTLD